MTRRFVGVVLALLALLLVCFGRLAADPSSLLVDADHPSVDHARPFGDRQVGNDLTRLFLPHHLAIARLGHLPLWDDRGFGGRPLVGNPQAGLFYPPTWLAWWSGSPSALGWITVGHLLWAGLGTYRLARTLGLGGWGTLVASGCFQASPYVLAQVFEGHYPHVWAACWYPWAFDAALRLRRGDRRGALELAPILAATFLVGHPQEGFYLLIALACWAAFEGVATIRARRVREAWPLWAWGAVSMLLAVGLIAIELIPDAMAQTWGVHWGKLSLRLASRYHLYPINALQLLSPRALGGPTDYFGHENYWESLVSFGLIPLALATIAVAWSPDRRAVRGWLILLAASLLFASGRKLGLFAVFFQVVPGMERFRVPARSLFLASLGGAMLAGLGVEALRIKASRAEGWPRLARRSAFAVLLLAVVVLVGGRLAGHRGLASKVEDRPSITLRDLASENPRTGRVPEFDRVLLALARVAADPVFWLGLGGLGVGLMIPWRSPRARLAVASSLGVLGLVELGLDGRTLIATSRIERFLGSDPIGEALTQARPPGREPIRIRAVDTLYDDLHAAHLGFSKTNVGDSFQIQHAAELYETLYHVFDADLFDHKPAGPLAIPNDRREIRQAVLDRMGVSLLVSDRRDPASPWPLIASGVWNGSDYAIYRNPTALPRSYVVPRAEVAPDDARTVARFAEINPREAVLMPVDPLGPVRSDRQPFTPAEWLSNDPDVVSIRVETQAPGLLVVADTWMPGWTAEVDGKPAPVLRGNRAQRVVPLPEAGRHEVTLRYRTPGLTPGLAITVASATIWTSLLFATILGRLSLTRPGSLRYRGLAWSMTSARGGPSPWNPQAISNRITRAGSGAGSCSSAPWRWRVRRPS